MGKKKERKKRERWIEGKQERRKEGNTLNHFLIVLPLALILGLTSFPISTVLT